MSEHPPKTEENFDEKLSYKKTLETEIEYLESSRPTEPAAEAERLETINSLREELGLLETHIAEHKDKTSAHVEHKEKMHAGPFRRFWGSVLATGGRGITLFAIIYKFASWCGLTQVDYVSGKGGESHGGGGHGGGHGHDDHGGHGGGGHH